VYYRTSFLPNLQLQMFQNYWKIVFIIIINIYSLNNYLDIHPNVQLCAKVYFAYFHQFLQFSVRTFYSKFISYWKTWKIIESKLITILFFFLKSVLIEIFNNLYCILKILIIRRFSQLLEPFECIFEILNKFKHKIAN